MKVLLAASREQPEVRGILVELHAILSAHLGELGESLEGGELVDRVIFPQASTRGLSDGQQRHVRAVDLDVIVRRARWKSKACRFAIERRVELKAGASSEAIRSKEDVLRRERDTLEDCYAWMLDSPKPLPDDRPLRDVAACFDTVARAAEICMELEASGSLIPGPPAELLFLLAEAQSALLAGLAKCELRGDSDQRDLFTWLKDQTTKHRIYVDRHMRLDDPADSSRSEDLLRRLESCAEQIRSAPADRSTRDGLLERVQQVAETLGVQATADDWKSLEELLGEWTVAGLDVDDADLVDLLEPLLEEGVAGVPPQAVQAAMVGASGDDGAGGPQQALERARQLLEGKCMLVLGDKENETATADLETELGLASVRWVVLGDEEVGPILLSEITREEIEIVLISTRLPEEDYADFKALCMKAGKPFVRVTEAPEPALVAHQILRQIGWRLRAEAASKG